MMALQSKLNPQYYKPIIHVIATTDHTSENLIRQKKQDQEISSTQDNIQNHDNHRKNGHVSTFVPGGASSVALQLSSPNK